MKNAVVWHEVGIGGAPFVGFVAGLLPGLLGGHDFWLCYLPPLVNLVAGCIFRQKVLLVVGATYFGLLGSFAMPSQHQILPPFTLVPERLDPSFPLWFYPAIGLFFAFWSLIAGIAGWLLATLVSRSTSIFKQRYRNHRKFVDFV